MNKPDNGLTTEAKVVRIIDGDTLEVSVERIFKVRLKDFLADEKNTPNGVKSKEGLLEIIQPGDIVTVFIPSCNPYKLMDIQSFDRLLAIVWKGINDIRDLMVAKGYGRYLKKGEKPREGI